VKRDNDYIRNLLFKYEGEEKWLFIVPGGTMDSTPEECREKYHIKLMMDQGLIAAVGKDTMRMTSQGHDYLDAIRDNGIWQKTKESAASVGGVTIGIMKDIAVGFVKQKLAEITGIALA